MTGWYIIKDKKSEYNPYAAIGILLSLQKQCINIIQFEEGSTSKRIRDTGWFIIID